MQWRAQVLESARMQAPELEVELEPRFRSSLGVRMFNIIPAGIHRPKKSVDPTPAAWRHASAPMEVLHCTEMGAYAQPTVSASSAESDAGSFASTVVDIDLSERLQAMKRKGCGADKCCKTHRRRARCRAPSTL